MRQETETENLSLSSESLETKEESSSQKRLRDNRERPNLLGNETQQERASKRQRTARIGPEKEKRTETTETAQAREFRAWFMNAVETPGLVDRRSTGDDAFRK